ncbi:MAG: polysaccharide deacetylase family protein [Polyangiaceae bacterium]|nr:polysaccharide deacetylase family protein [Polyangiaceae bacterium]
MRLCSVSVDLDEVRHYFAIHGLGQPSPEQSNVVYDTAIERLSGFAAAQQIPLTWFAVAADAARPANSARLRDLAGVGHEIASHSLDHRYDLTLLGRRDMERQVIDAVTLLERATGQRPVGFRAPGYLMNDTLFDVVRHSGAQYDSSVFPCPAYGIAKLLALGYGRLRKRRSSSIPGAPAAWLGPTRPYPSPRRDAGIGGRLLELPIQVAGPVRIPYIGTTLTLLGPSWARRLTALLRRESFVNLELHGIDALDYRDGLHPLLPHQPDVRVPFERKFAALGAAIEALRQQGRAYVTLREAAVRIG